MSRTVRYSLAITLLAAWLLAWHPSSDLASRVLASLERYMLQYPPEKVYVFTDKPHYSVGENLWYKGWLVNGSDHHPNSPSKIVYVELIAPDSTVAMQQTLRVVDGTLNGDFYLPHDLPTGHYTLRAYTTWMRNFDHEYFFHRQISIGNLAVESVDEPTIDNELVLRLFPEGGEWVSGLPVVFGIEAVHKSGTPVKGLTVAIIDRFGNEVATSEISSQGLGKVDLPSKPGEAYNAVVKDAADKRHIGLRFNLPDPRTQGFSMQVDGTQPQDIGIRIWNNLGAAIAQQQELVVLGHVRGVVYYAAVGRIDRDEFVAQIDRNRFPPGIIQFTLFTEVGVPVLERLVYNPDRSPLSVSMQPSRTTYTTRELAEVLISVREADGEPVDGNLAVSVTDASQVIWPENQLDVRSYLQLVSDLERPVPNPGLYDQDGDSALIEADYLMLTRGWRRFDWQEVMSSESSDMKYPLEQGLTISGTVINKHNKRLTADQNVILALLGDVKEFYDTETDANGRFLFQNLLYPDSTEVLVQTLDSRKRRHYDIVLDTVANFDPRLPSKLLINHAADDGRYATYLSQSRVREQIDRSYGLSNDVRMLGEITVTAEREVLPPPQRRSLIVEPDKVIKAEDVGGYAANPLEMLRGRTAAFRVTGFGRDMTVTFNRGIAWGGSPVPLFILDGIEVDLSTLVSIPASNVESIELLTDVGSLAIYGARGSNGVIAVNTKPGGAVFAAREGIINRAFAGYYNPREFYAPDYSEQLPIHEKPDSRSTIWWEPNLVLSSNGDGIVRFWTSDDAGPRFQNRSTRYRVYVEGITSTGKPIVGWSYITVE